MDRRQFVLAAAAAPFALRSLPHPMAFVTADSESHVAVVDLTTGAVLRRIHTHPGPRSVERVGELTVVGHTGTGPVSVLDAHRVRHVLEGFEEPRYAAAARDGRHAFVSDSGRADLATVDVVRGVVVARLKLRQWPRHLSLSPDGTTLFVSLGTASREIAVVDVRDPARLVLQRTLRPPFLAHDVGVSPAGRVWITAGEASTISAHGRVLEADAAPQHVTFAAGRAFVTSGAAGTLRVYDEASTRLLRVTAITGGSYNVQRSAGRVITPSLASGTLSVADAHGRLRERVHVASSCHDAA
jgi:DNA-binding beta-propeller fold protein YncE